MFREVLGNLRLVISGEKHVHMVLTIGDAWGSEHSRQRGASHDAEMSSLRAYYGHLKTICIAGRSPSAKKHVNMMLVMEVREGPKTQGQARLLTTMSFHLFEDMMSSEIADRSPSAETRPHDVGHGGPRGFQHSRPSWLSRCGVWPPLQGHDDLLSSSWYCWRGVRQIIQHPVCLPTALEKYDVELLQRVLSSVFRTVDDADTPWYPQFFYVVTFESQCSTKDGPTIGPSRGLRHGYVRIDESRDPALLFSSRLLLVHHVAFPDMSSDCEFLQTNRKG